MFTPSARWMCCIMYSISKKIIFFFLDFENSTLHTLCQAMNFCRKISAALHYLYHKVLSYIEYRAVSGVFQTMDPPLPLHPASVSSPGTKGGGYTLAGRWGGGGVNISEDARHWIGLLQYNPSTTHIFSSTNRWGMMLANEARLLKWICTR